MAVLESFCGRGLTISCTVVGIYLLVAYVVAFAIDLWWILESPAAPPIPAYLLCLGYFILFTSSALLLHGLSVKKTTFLLVWLFMMGILLGPEAGLVLYLSIHYWFCSGLVCSFCFCPVYFFHFYSIPTILTFSLSFFRKPKIMSVNCDWKVTSLYGLIEVTCWTCRIVVNAIGLLCVQSLHSNWREEKTVLLRLETLKATSLPKAQGRKLSISSVFRASEKKNVPKEERQEKPDSDSYDYLRTGLDFKNEDDYSYVDAQYVEESEFSEFNASSFDPTVIDARLENMPYLTIRKKQKQIVGTTELFLSGKENISKTRSLIDFRETDFYSRNFYNEMKHSIKQKPHSAILKKNFQAPENQQTNTNSNSLDTKIIKNKNLKILKKLSPFYNKKPVKVNIYRINPPENFMTSNLDSQLNKIYSNRGMYAFDEKLKKVIYYPPEFFDKSIKFRSRIDSYGSSQSRSSIDTDSEDIRHISDVAL